MPPRSRLESLPPELLSGILTRCSREDLANLAQTCSNLRAACRKELVSYPFTMEVTSDNLKSWVAYFRKEDTLLTWGARSLDITIIATMQDFLDAFDDIDPTVFDVDARPIHPDASRIFPLPSSLRKLSLQLNPMLVWHQPSEIFLLLLLLRPLPERCPRLEELSIRARPKHPSDEIDRCIRRMTCLRKLSLQVGNLPSIPNRLSLLPASPTDLSVWALHIQTREEVATPITWAREIQKFSLALCSPQGTANALMILSRGGATHLTELNLWENRGDGNPAEIISWQGALSVGFQEFSILQPPLRALSLKSPSAWSDPLHLPLLHTAVASTLTKLHLQDMDSCIFPSHLPWPRLQSIELIEIPKMGYQGRLINPIFPVLTAITTRDVHEIQALEDLFPALEKINWQCDTITPEQMASLIRHDIKRIDMVIHYLVDFYEPLWEAMGGHTIDLITLGGYIPFWMHGPANNGERIFPEFPNIREFTIEWGNCPDSP